MKKKNVIILLFFIISMQFINADSIDISVGGGFTGYFIPTVNPYNFETTYVNPTTVVTASYLNLLFGFAISAPVDFTYYFNNDWGVGANVELGYSLQGGPQVYLKDAPSGYVPSDYSVLYNAFLGIFNFTAKSPKLKYDFRIVMEVGLMLRPGGLVGFYRGSRSLYLLGYGTSDIRALCYAGPDFFIGFQKQLAKSLIIMPGFRFSAEFTGYYVEFPYSTYREFYAQINFGLEFRILWNKNIQLSSSGGGGSKNSNSSKKSNSNNGNSKNNGTSGDKDKKEDYK
jgi:hypothetical protein